MSTKAFELCPSGRAKPSLVLVRACLIPADDLDQRIQRVGRRENAEQLAVLIVDDHAADFLFGHGVGDFVQRRGNADRWRRC